MSRARRTFPPELLARLHAMQVTAALDLLGLYWKHDPDFKPINLTGEYILDASQIGDDKKNKKNRTLSVRPVRLRP